MRRREFIGFIGGVLACPIAARAQQPAKVARVGYLRGDLFAAQPRHWWVRLPLTERVRGEQDLATRDDLAQHMATVEAELPRLSTTAVWANQVP